MSQNSNARYLHHWPYVSKTFVVLLEMFGNHLKIWNHGTVLPNVLHSARFTCPFTGFTASLVRQINKKNLQRNGRVCPTQCKGWGTPRSRMTRNKRQCRHISSAEPPTAPLHPLHPLHPLAHAASTVSTSLPCQIYNGHVLKNLWAFVPRRQRSSSSRLGRACPFVPPHRLPDAEKAALGSFCRHPTSLITEMRKSCPFWSAFNFFGFWLVYYFGQSTIYQPRNASWVRVHVHLLLSRISIKWASKLLHVMQV